MKWVALVLVAVSIVTPPTPGAARAGSYGTELPFAAGTSARSSGMGLAATSLPGTPSTQYFNPALLTTTERKRFEFYRTTLFDSDAQYHSVAYSHPSLDWGTLGVTVLRLDVSGVEERDGSNMLLSSDLKNSQTRYLFGYALGIMPSVSAGVNLKVDNQSFGSYSGTAVGLDIGFLATKTFSKYWWLGTVRGSLVAENAIEPSMKLDRDDVPDPRRMTFGLSVEGRRGDIGTATALDLVSPKYSPFHARLGQEVSYRDMVAVRAGFDGSTPTFGFGGTYRFVSLDYAYRDEDLGSNHRVSLCVAFGPSLDQERHARRMREDAELQERVNTKVGEHERSQLDTLMRQADERLASRDLEGARKKYEMVLMWDPENARAVSQIARCNLEGEVAAAQAWIERDDYATALHHYRRASREAPDDPRVVRGLAMCDSAISESQGRSSAAGALVTQGITLYAQGRYLDALSALEGAVQLDPANEMARELLEKSRASVNATIADHMRQARAHERRGDLAAAIASVESAASMTEDRKDVADELARLRGLLARRDQKSARVVEPAAAEPTVDPNLDLESLDKKYRAGIAHFEGGDFEQAARLLSQVWSAAPSYRDVARPLVRAYLLHGMALYGNGRYEEAIEVWQRVLIVDPDNQKSKRYLQKAQQERTRLSGGER